MLHQLFLLLVPQQETGRALRIPDRFGEAGDRQRRQPLLGEQVQPQNAVIVVARAARRVVHAGREAAPHVAEPEPLGQARHRGPIEQLPGVAVFKPVVAAFETAGAVDEPVRPLRRAGNAVEQQFGPREQRRVVRVVHQDAG